MTIRRFFVEMFLFLGFLVSGIECFGQETSKNNYTGNWTTNASWIDGSAPAFTNIGSTGVSFNIQGYITLGSPSPAPASNMTFRNNPDQALLSFTVTDTLVVFGNITMGNNSMDLVIGPGALLIVFGNVSLGNNMDVNSTGNIIVTGTFSKGGAANQGSYTGGGNVYGGTISVPGAWMPAADKKNTGTDLQNDLPDVYDFIQNGGNTPLPIELLYFNANAFRDKIELSWSTASELNFDYFDVQKSSDGKNFQSIARVNGHGTTNERKDYSLDDEKPYIGKNYYRLKSVDFDGYTEYFNVVMVDFDGSKGFSISPNPSDGLTFTAETNFMPQTHAYIVIYSTLGSEIGRFEVFGDKSQLTMPVKLASGVYYARYISRDFTSTNRVVVK